MNLCSNVCGKSVNAGIKLSLVPLFNRTAVRIRLTDLFINLLVSPISHVSIITDSLERVISARVLGSLGLMVFLHLVEG